MPKAELVYRPAKQSEKAEAGDYKHLCQIWEGLTVTTAKQWAAEMREHPDFRQFVLNPTHRIVFIDYKGFELFIKWKSRNRYKPKKETLAEMLENIKREKQLGV
ncbi:excisionase [Streptococcus pluranimalium]|uniref:excisionase n=1 Tax=Streptococcus pluranimalium TaxID=82348 RepID=UPI003F680D7C